MPSRNVLKVDVANTYYHVYARGASRTDLFIEQQDYEHFLGLFARYLSAKTVLSNAGTAYPNFRGKVKLLAFSCLPNHFHVLLYQHTQGAMTGLMRCVMTSYSRYVNLKYKKTGSLFESRYKASRIDADNYLQHISRYIHLNPRYWKHYPFSSYKYYLGHSPEWLDPEPILHLFKDRVDYTKFLEDYEDHKAMLSELKYELADQ